MQVFLAALFFVLSLLGLRRCGVARSTRLITGFGNANLFSQTLADLVLPKDGFSAFLWLRNSTPPLS
jgi:hypothetical protein